MRNFLSVNLLILLVIVFSCTRKINPQGSEYAISSKTFRPVIPKDTTVIYKTGVNAYGHYLSGLLVVKSYQNENSRILFTTEMGVKLFDFEFKDQEFIIHHCIDKLNRKPVLKLLEKDFSLMMARGLKGKKVLLQEKENLKVFVLKEEKEFFFYHINSDGIIEKIETLSHKGKEKTLLTFQRESEVVPSQIFLDHRNLDLTMKLDLIQR